VAWRERRRDDRDVRRRGECGASRPARLARRGRSRAQPGWLPRWPDGWPRAASRSWTCPPSLGRRVRRLSTCYGRKSDEADVCPWASPRTPSEPGHGMPGRCRSSAARAHKHQDDLDAVLLRVYAHCIDGQADVANRRITDALDPMKGSLLTRPRWNPGDNDTAGATATPASPADAVGWGRIRCSRRNVSLGAYLQRCERSVLTPGPP
jgi:hypothetical protein